MLGIAREKARAIVTQPSTASRKPGRVGEMMQRHDRFEVALPQRPNHFAVVRSRFIVPMPFGRFDAAPLDGEAMRILPPRAGQIEVLLEQFVMAAGFT